MKKLTTISLFIFFAVVMAILVAGLVIYQNNKGSQVKNSQMGNMVSNNIKQLTSSGKSLVLNMSEIRKHNNASDCWMLINGKVYDITSFFGSHPGGNSTMTPSCGKDATAAYDTKDPYTTSNSGGRSHSSYAARLLDSYYIGDLNQTIGQQNITQTNTVVTTTTRRDEFDN